VRSARRGKTALFPVRRSSSGCALSAGSWSIKVVARKSAQKLKRPAVADPPTMPYTHEEVLSLLTACEQFTDCTNSPAGRTRAACGRSCCFAVFRATHWRCRELPGGPAPGESFVSVHAEDGRPVFLSASAVCLSMRWTVVRARASAMVLDRQGLEGHAARKLAARLPAACEIAGVRNGHPHRFRDTLAVELIIQGVPMERVSILLGHSSLKVTEKHYAPWSTRGRRSLKRPDSGVANDPVAQIERLRSESRRAEMRGWFSEWLRRIRDTERNPSLTDSKIKG
jgi:hypothetical protein